VALNALKTSSVASTSAIAALLADALKGNASVKYLKLDVQGLLCPNQESTSEDLQPLLHFIATSQALWEGEGLEELTARLLPALALNSNITEFTLYDDVPPSPQSFIHFVTNAPFLCKLKLEVEAFVNFSAHDLATLGAAIGQTQTLHELHLKSFLGRQWGW
jgi:hypothetical protein